MLRTVSVNGPQTRMRLRNSRMTCDSEGILEGIPLFTNTDIATDSRMNSPLNGLPLFDGSIWIVASRLVS